MTEEHKALVTLAELAMRDRLGDDAYEKLYDEEGNRRVVDWRHTWIMPRRTEDPVTRGSEDDDRATLPSL